MHPSYVEACQNKDIALRPAEQGYRALRAGKTETLQLLESGHAVSFCACGTACQPMEYKMQ